MNKAITLVLTLLASLEMVGAARAAHVSAQRHGPALLALVRGVEPRFVIGYSAAGALGGASPHVNAYLEIEFDVCRGGRGPRRVTIERSIPIRRDASGAGYLSEPLTMQQLFDLDPSQFDVKPVAMCGFALAFFVDGRWDSNCNVNYRFGRETLTQQAGLEVADPRAFLLGKLR